MQMPLGLKKNYLLFRLKFLWDDLTAIFIRNAVLVNIIF